jgi:hypothetical protein
MAYTHITFGAAKTLLAVRLSDPSKVFWTDAELGFALIEAKRMWNAITLYDREQGQFVTSDGTAFYDLRTSLISLSDGTTALRGETVRDRALVSEIEYHLIEPQSFSSWTGTDQFTLSQITTAVQRRRDRFLSDTACVVSRRTGDTIDGFGNVTMADTVIGIRRAVFHADSGPYSTLQPSDERMVVARSKYWTTPGSPVAYSTSVKGNLSVQVMPPPQESGTLESVVVTSGAAVDVTANSNVGTLIGVPNDYTWGIKYGAIADLLRDSNSVDSARADVCEQLYQLAVNLAKSMPVILSASINNVHVTPGALAVTDLRRNGWEGMSRGTPTDLSVAGPNLVVLTRTPGATQVVVTLDVVRNAIVPASNTDDSSYLEISREHLDALLSMAQRICSFKLGGAEYAEAETLSQKFFDEAERYSYRRSAAASALQVMVQNTVRQTYQRPWEHEPKIVQDRSDEVRSERNARRRPFRKQ